MGGLMIAHAGLPEELGQLNEGCIEHLEHSSSTKEGRSVIRSIWAECTETQDRRSGVPEKHGACRSLTDYRPAKAREDR